MVQRAAYNMLFVSYPLRLPAIAAAAGTLLLVSKAILTLGDQSNSVANQFTVLPDVFPVAANRSEFPFIVSVRENGRHICSGTILTAQWILTAAHCFELSIVSQITIAAGKFDLFMDDPRDQIIQIRKIFNHPKFNPSTNDHDISLLQTETDIDLDTNVQSVNLEPTGYVRAPSGVVLGWGMLPNETSIVLEKVTIPFFPLAVCTRSPWPGVDVLDSILCGQNLGQRCQGDRGGPLICSSLCGMEPVQCGLVSKDIGCDSTTIPTVFTRVTFHLDFIMSTTATNSRSPSSTRQTEL